MTDGAQVTLFGQQFCATCPPTRSPGRESIRRATDPGRHRISPAEGGREGCEVSDEEQFRTFVAGRSQALLSTAYLLTRDWARAEDLLQAALVSGWLSWRRISVSPEQYIRRVLLNEYLAWWRRRWRHEVPTAELPEPGRRAGAVPDQTDAVDARQAMWRLLGTLPRRQRAVLVLRYYEDCSEREIAALLGCSPGTVKSQTAKAMARLRAELGHPSAVAERTVP
jgi:RNA polymerase sigma-70 factor (sigma-E family)